MLISENKIKLENEIERHLYENDFNNVVVSISVHDINVEISIRADDKRLTISMSDDDFENDDDFYDYVVMVMNKHLK